LKDNPNLDFMFGGHVTGEGIRVDTYNGNTVISMMADYQGMADGGSAFLRLLTFRPERNEIVTNTYSPWLNAHLPHWGNPAIVPYDFGRAEIPFHEIGRATVSSGARVELPWDGLEASTDYEWFAQFNADPVSTRTETFDFQTSPVTYTSWRNAFFNDNDPAGAREADPDNDGYSNYFEYVFNGDPWKPHTLQRPQPVLVFNEGEFIVTYRRLRNTGLQWRAEVSENLIQWHPWQNGIMTMQEQVEDTGDGFETVRLLIQNPGTALFWRLRVD